MLARNRKQLETILTEIIESIYDKVDIREKLQIQLLEQHSILPGTANMLILGMINFAEVSVEELVWYTKEIKNVLENNGLSELVEDINLDNFFSKSEIVSFNNTKKVLDSNINLLPLTIDNVTPVIEDQWITVKDTNFLKKLHDSQVLNYNKNTQRNITIKTKNEENFYDITLKTKSVNEIYKLLEKGLFIPNVLTFNINRDNNENEFEYDLRNNKLTLFNGQLDIIDGYHRYRAIMRLKNNIPEFNYPFIIHIVNFDENKACQYIAQEDKINKMPKQYSKSLDFTNPSNIIAKRLNEDSSCYLHGNIGRNGNTLIDFSQFSNIIAYNFTLNDSKDEIKITSYLKKSFNTLIEEHHELLDEKINFKILCVIVRIFALYYNKNINATTIVLTCLKNIDKLNDALFVKKDVKKVIFNDIDGLVRRYSSV